jgi:hypothetical protein
MSIEPRRKTRACLLCDDTGNNAAALEVIQMVQDIIDDGIGSKSMTRIAQDVRDYLDEDLIVKIDWEVEAILDHLTSHTVNTDHEARKHERTLALIMQNCRDNMREAGSGRVHAPSFSMYLKAAASLDTVRRTKSRPAK